MDDVNVALAGAGFLTLLAAGLRGSSFEVPALEVFPLGIVALPATELVVSTLAKGLDTVRPFPGRPPADDKAGFVLVS